MHRLPCAPAAGHLQTILPLLARPIAPPMVPPSMPPPPPLLCLSLCQVCWAKSVLTCPCLQPAASWCPSPADMAGGAQPAPRQRLRHGPRLVEAALCLLALCSGVAGVQYVNDELLWMKAHWEDYKLAFPWSAAMKQRDMESTRQLQVGAAPVGAVAGSSCACLHVCAVLMTQAARCCKGWGNCCTVHALALA